MTPNPNPSPELREAIAAAKIKARDVLGIAWHNLEEISRFELILAALSPQTLPAPGEVSTAVELLERYAAFIRDDVKADDLERHPYLPLIEQTIDALTTQPITSQEHDDADRANGVGQDELVAGVKRALQHPAGDHDGWTDAGMEHAFFRWPVIVNALNVALATVAAANDEGVAEAAFRAGHRAARIRYVPAEPNGPTRFEDVDWEDAAIRLLSQGVGK